MAHDLRDYIFLEEICGLFGRIFLLLLPNKIHVRIFRQRIFSRTLSYTKYSPVVLILVYREISSVGPRHPKGRQWALALLWMN